MIRYLRSFCDSLLTTICAMVGPSSSCSSPAASRACGRWFDSALPAESRRTTRNLVELPTLDVFPLRTNDRDVSDPSLSPPWFLALYSAASAFRFSCSANYCCVCLSELRSLLMKSIFVCKYCTLTFYLCMYSTRLVCLDNDDDKNLEEYLINYKITSK